MHFRKWKGLVLGEDVTQERLFEESCLGWNWRIKRSWPGKDGVGWDGGAFQTDKQHLGRLWSNREVGTGLWHKEERVGQVEGWQDVISILTSSWGRWGAVGGYSAAEWSWCLSFPPDSLVWGFLHGCCNSLRPLRGIQYAGVIQRRGHKVVSPEIHFQSAAYWDLPCKDGFARGIWCLWAGLQGWN